MRIIRMLLVVVVLALLASTAAAVFRLYPGTATAAAGILPATATDREARLTASPGCDPARPRAAGDFDLTIESGGLTRDYILHVPPSYDGAEATPLVLNLHGLGSNAAEQADYSELSAKADEAGFILVMPQGMATASLSSRHWNFLTLIPGDPDDVAFISDLLDALESQLCIDQARTFAAGMSNGAQMSVRLACDLSDRVAAIAPVAGVYLPPWSPLDLAAEPGCLSTRPVPIVAFHGTTDAIVPFDGGYLGLGFPFRLRHIEDEVMPAWAEHNGCAGSPEVEQETENVRLVRFDGCRAGATVELYAVAGGDHQWPGADDFGSPDVADEIDANDIMWDFFQAHPLVVVSGDASCDGTVDAVDAALLLQRDAGLAPPLPCSGSADVNEDGSVNSVDATLILQYTVGLIGSLPPP